MTASAAAAATAAAAAASPRRQGLESQSHDRDVAKESIETDDAHSPVQKPSFDLADPGIFFFPTIPRGKLCSFPWLFPKASSPSPDYSYSDAERTTNRGSETPTLSLVSCDECGKACRDAKALSQHKRCHRKQHRCAEPGCGMGFSTRRDLERHRLSVHERKPTSCPFCYKKGFGMRVDNLKRHIAACCRGAERTRRLTPKQSNAETDEG
ncbi:hypothetical protein GQ53DRAFT_752630 [Thozetella sp. PMI_491]|nr:hypothetical protein GQ53DRAFT_752630 [Thozetella sp. PMI_491]